jgi:ribosomal protein S18 acetylase RimI-like enzyme
VINNKLTIRQATIHDLPKIVPIFDTYREYFKQEKNPAEVERFLFERFEHRESVLFIVQECDDIVGFAHLYPIFSSLSLQRVWVLNDFFILENYRNKGLGKQLIQEVRAFSVLTKAKGIELSVEHSNTNAWRFWKKQDFEMDSEFRYYFYKS